MTLIQDPKPKGVGEPVKVLRAEVPQAEQDEARGHKITHLVKIGHLSRTICCQALRTP